MSTTVKLRSRDGQIIEVEQKLAQQSESISSTLNQANMPTTGITIDCPTIAGAILSMAFEWLQQHINDPPAPESEGHFRLEGLTTWDEQFFSRLPLHTLYELLLAGDQLRMSRLLNACNKTLARMMIGKSPEEIRTIFDIPNDL